MYEHLKALRESLGMTQAEFGESVGVAKSTYNNYEIGARDPKSDFWIAVAQRYGVTIDYLMGFSDDPKKTSEAKNAPSDLSEEALHVARDYEGLDRHGRNMTKIVITEEQKRMVEERRRRETGEAELQGTRIIPLYYTPAAAGMTSPAVGEDFDYIEISNDAPRNADFVKAGSI